MTIGWSPELSVGLEDIDEQHREIVRLLGEVHGRIDAGDAPGAAGALDALAEAVVRHFAVEEALMEGAGYPDRAAHKRAHDLFVQDLMALLQEESADGLTEEVGEWARGRVPEWLSFHIQTNDAPLARYLAARRPGPRPSPVPGKPRA